MARIGSVHLDIKPVLSDDTLDGIADRIADAVYVGFLRGMDRAKSHGAPTRYGDTGGRTRDEVDAILAECGHDLPTS